MESALGWFFDSTGSVVALFIVMCSIYLFCCCMNKLPPGPTVWPIFGTFPDISKTGGDKMHLYFHQLHEKYGPLATMYFGKYPIVIASGYETVKEVFVDREDIVAFRSDYIPGIRTHEHLNKGIIYGNGQLWSKSKKALQSGICVALKTPRHEDFVLGAVNELMKDFMDRKGAMFQPRLNFLHAVCAWYLGTAFGKRYCQDDPALKRIAHLVVHTLANDGPFTPCGTIPLLRFIPIISKSYKKYVAGYNALDEAIKSEIAARELRFDENRMGCVVDVFFKEKRESKGSLTDEQIAFCIGDILIGGVYPTAHTLDWALLYMVAYPHIQEKCWQEIQQVCGDAGQVKFNDTDRLPYVRATILETERIASVVPTLIPHHTIKDITVRGYTIPEGTIMTGHTASVHMDKTQWREPEQFIPDRFLNTDGKLLKKPPAFLPFGYGSRSCPGYTLAENDMILVFANLVQSMEFTCKGKANLAGKYTAGTHPRSNEIIAKPRKCH